MISFITLRYPSYFIETRKLEKVIKSIIKDFYDSLPLRSILTIKSKCFKKSLALRQCIANQALQGIDAIKHTISSHYNYLDKNWDQHQLGSSFRSYRLGATSIW